MFVLITEKHIGKKIFLQLNLKENLSNVRYNAPEPCSVSIMAILLPNPDHCLDNLRVGMQVLEKSDYNLSTVRENRNVS